MRVMICAAKSSYVLPIKFSVQIYCVFLWTLSRVPSQIHDVPTRKTVVFDWYMLPESRSIIYHRCYDVKCYHLDHCMMIWAISVT